MNTRLDRPLLALGELAPALSSSAVAQDPEHAKEFGMQHPGASFDASRPFACCHIASAQITLKASPCST